MPSNTDHYLSQHKERFLEELKAFLRIPSVSTLKECWPSVRQAAAFVADALQKAGAKASLLETNGQPLVYASKQVDPALPTILVYGHYDVQPVGDQASWDHPPFLPTIHKGAIYARGASDDKGQVYAHIKAFEAMVANDALPCNVKFLIEGEEEIGSPSLTRFLQDSRHQALLDTDVVLVSDTSMAKSSQPEVAIGLRGIVTLDVAVHGPRHDLHSGVYGGAVANPIQVLCKLLAGLKDPKERIAISGFYDKVHTPSSEERILLAKDPFDLEAYRASLGIQKVSGEEGYTTSERTGIRPSLEINGIWGGHTGEGFKTVLPASAYAKLSVRTVPHQNPAHVAQQLCDYFRDHAPQSVRVEVKVHPGVSAALTTDRRATATQAAMQAFAQAWGHKAILRYQGGSIPILKAMQEKLHADVTFLGFGLDSDGIHAPNEHFSLTHFAKSMATIIAFYQIYTKMAMA